MTFQEFTTQQRPKIEKRLVDFISTQSHLDVVKPWGNDLQKRLLNFVGEGKLLRGSLILLAHEMYGGKNETDAITLAAAIELFHSSFLIHDDIIDQDAFRRGKMTFYKQYEDVAKQKGHTKPERVGENLGICAGDIVFFLGFQLLNDIADYTIAQLVFQTITKELSLVGLGQMQDVALSDTKTIPTEEEIMQVYLYKTARYTFSLPLMLGALLSGEENPEIKKLEKLGEALGIIFQIKDDELGIFGDEKETGKPVGSDIREGKKTLYYYYLSKIQNEERKKSALITFGKKDLDDAALRTLQEIIKTEGIQDMLSKKIERLIKDYTGVLSSTKLSKENKRILLELLSYSLKRKS